MPRGNSHQCQSQQKILVKVDRGKAIGFLNNEAFLNSEVSFFGRGKQSFKGTEWKGNGEMQHKNLLARLSL